MAKIRRIFPGRGKSSLMNNISDRMIEKGFSIEYHHCPSDPKSIDAIVIEELQICILYGTTPYGDVFLRQFK